MGQVEEEGEEEGPTVRRVNKRQQNRSCRFSDLQPKGIVATNEQMMPHREGRTMRIAIYARVSTRKQDNENQLLQLRDFAAKHGWQIVAEYVDVVTGSGKKDRAQFEALMLAASQRQFDLVLFWKLDRFSREGTRATLRLLTLLDSYGCSWRSFQEPFFDSCGVMRDVVISIMATLAEQERIAISERTKAGLQRAVKAGRILGRRPVVVDIAWARKLQSQGSGLRPIAKQMRISVNTLARALRKAA
jgi:DNA invertase Pin-like site-specific DNA recombinase